MEKKLAVVNGASAASEVTRQKATSYLELKKKNMVDKMGTSIKDRHNFFRTQDEEFCNALRVILKSTELSEDERYENFLKELQTMWPYKIEKFIETDLMKFELLVEYEKFTCILIGSNKQELQTEILKYFDEMLQPIETKPVDSDNDSIDSISLHSL